MAKRGPVESRSDHLLWHPGPHKSWAGPDILRQAFRASLFSRSFAATLPNLDCTGTIDGDTLSTSQLLSEVVMYYRPESGRNIFKNKRWFWLSFACFEVHRRVGLFSALLMAWAFFLDHVHFFTYVSAIVLMNFGVAVFLVFVAN